MSFDTLGRSSLDYQPCRYGGSRLSFRGPGKALGSPFVAFLGGTHTYGKFVQKPFPDLVDEALPMPCVNLGYMNAGLDVMVRDPFLSEVPSKAAATVLQVVSPRNMSNRFYSVHPRRNDRFLRPSKLLQSMYRDVDFSQFNFTKHMLTNLEKHSPDLFELVVEELQTAWVARTRSILRRARQRSVLLWISDRAPDEDCLHFGKDPWFVTDEMLEEAAKDAAACVKVVVPASLLAKGTEGMVFSELEAPAARRLLGPAVHAAVADALVPVLKDIL